MPTVQPGGKVLVTGANGYIAMWVIKLLLERGYSVRGTVRSADRIPYLRDRFKSYGEKLKVVVVSDITEEGAFDEAVKDVDGIQHIASPVPETVEDPDALITPAVQGTIGILKSALKNGTRIKRIVITSSCAAIVDNFPHPMTFNEDHWNEGGIKEVEEKGKDASRNAKYRASKVLSEKAAWKLYNDHKDTVGWDLTVLNPAFVFGPPIHEVRSPTTLNSSMQGFWDNVISVDSPKSWEALSFGASWVDVRDVALSHVLALEKEEAGGQRIILSEGPFIWQDWIDVAHKIQASGRELPKGFPDIERIYMLKFDASKGERILGIKYRTKEESWRDILEDLEERGW
ncbi:D-lactaldehyde dehydrogenase [Coprinopsis cinerea okayama7|uniref:D-lactaldehyde dehydrogenase n=1 Tax=Coprinopsis cinerea (strain Okayama-7 / 130 / ATCC MYA-4618 / FGSC 9003) TaxID=240176 RepID=D6RNC1_COPC7|nr:D-lactaldehyde dehydrogenase [Coprinopsis cinerea okayama7\|eukprot:XP_002911037.1 D-lactaldehyde dehydrogenase [Coprinopsis cinerea okayama7\